MDEKIFFKVYRSYCVVIELLLDRGYAIEDSYILKIDSKSDYKTFIEWIGEDSEIEDIYDVLNLTFTKVKTETKLMTFWVVSLGKGDVQKIYETLRDQEIKNAIVVHENKITPCAKPVIKYIKLQKITIEPFLQSELQFNITKHSYVPKHIICSAAKKLEIMEKYSVSKDQLPRILSSDPVCRYLGATKGQLIKIIRPSDSISEVTLNGKVKELYDITYRLVV